jgi:hypothetical protein
MSSQPKSAVHQQPAKLSWQIISVAPPLFSGPEAFLHPIGQQGLRNFVSLQPWFLIGWEDLQAVRQLS